MLRSLSRYFLQTDISRFYQTIYTHSIPWALHGKPEAKADRSSQLIGNELDRLVRECQDGQTIGVPIGPDTSFIIAEIILSSIDEVLERKGLKNAMRYIDDYDFGFQTLSGADEALCLLEETLNDYELALNPSKTKIITLPWPTENIAISELRTFSFREAPVAQHSDILHYFDRAFSYAHANPKDAILRYAVSRLSGITVHPSNWEFCENLLLQCAISEPGTISFVLNQLLSYQQLEYDLHRDHIGDVMNSIIEQHAPQGHGGDVVWALWGLIVLKRRLRKKAATRAAKMKDPFVAILLCDADDHKLVQLGTEWDYLASLMSTEALHSEMWLFSYEANRRDWFDSSGKTDHVLASPTFALLKKAGVSFYDENLSDTIEPEEPEGWALSSSSY
ncbi:MAG: RNA-directed DNA polymerase [Sedimentisphaerales bacterium]|nr:RNA-directed DNA polymerase [Sedimentisphaerales bacterium]